MGMERLLPTGKQRFVCDHFFGGDIAWGEFSWMRQKYKKKKKEKENSNKKNKQTNKHKISMTVPRVISMGWIRTRSSTNHKKWNVPKSTHKRKTWHENNFKKHLLQKFLNINASRKHFCIKDILRYLIHFLSRLYCTN